MVSAELGCDVAGGAQAEHADDQVSESGEGSAASRLVERGWVGTDGMVTTAGIAAHHAVEQATDLAAARPWVPLGAIGTEQLAGALTAISRAAVAVLSFPDPIGVPCPRG